MNRTIFQDKDGLPVSITIRHGETVEITSEGLIYVDGVLQNQIRAVKEPAMTKRVTYICSYCGSNNINIEAHCKWSVEEQRVEAVEMCDKGHSCNCCHNEISLTEVELDES